MTKLHSEIEHFLRMGIGDFDGLALGLFAYQFEHNPTYRRFCEAQNVRPDVVTQWRQIPAVPISAFKTSELTTFPASRAAAIFHSSTTTTGVPSRHYMKDLRFYEAALKKQFLDWVLCGRSEASRPFLILAPAPGDAPHSSLTWMLDVVKRVWGQTGSTFLVERDRLDEPRLCRLLRLATSAGQPVILLGTTILFLAFFDYLRKSGETFTVPSGSRLMDTGGMKTERRHVTRVEFVRQAGEVLGIGAADCVNEYGMCELSSQFYGTGEGTEMNGAPWVRTRVVDIATGDDAPIGGQGLLSHYDLANVDSVFAVQTEDVGNLLQDGRFRLTGRAAGSELRGCSLAWERATF